MNMLRMHLVTISVLCSIGCAGANAADRLVESTLRDEIFYLSSCARYLKSDAVISFRTYSADLVRLNGFEFPVRDADICRYLETIGDALFEIVRGIRTNHPKNSHRELSEDTLRALSLLRSTGRLHNETISLRLIRAPIDDLFTMLRDFLKIEFVLLGDATSIVEVSAVGSKRLSHSAIVDVLEGLCRLGACALSVSDARIVVTVSPENIWERYAVESIVVEDPDTLKRLTNATPYFVWQRTSQPKTPLKEFQERGEQGITPKSR